MKKFMTLLIGCCFAFAVGVHAEQKDPKKQKSKPVQKQKGAPGQQAAPKTHGQAAHSQRPAKNPQIQTVQPQRAPKNPRTQIQPQRPAQHSSVQRATSQPVAKHKNPKLDNRTISEQPLRAPHTKNLPVTETINNTPRTFQSRHTNFRARPDRSIASATYNQNFRIPNSETWRGQNYAAFRTYRPQWHDRDWWHSHYTRVALIGGGWYFWNLGYWYPAWGYDTSADYYPYDGPIYVGNSAVPFDQVVADVQAILQEQGYYHGQVDGLVGPLTQRALAAYQRDHGLAATAAIDQPTLSSLGLNA